jgi:hypothetical protein
MRPKGARSLPRSAQEGPPEQANSPAYAGTGTEFSLTSNSVIAEIKPEGYVNDTNTIFMRLLKC